MKEKQLEIINKLSDAVKSEDFIDISYDLVDEMEKDSNPFVFVEPILKLMENNPNCDFGQPGPLVHFVEKFYKHGYEKLLLTSINNHPTLHTIWMLNRIMNDPNLNDRQLYINAMIKVYNRPDLDNEIKEEIKMFLS